MKKIIYLLFALVFTGSVSATELINTGTGNNQGYGLGTGNYQAAQNFSYTSGSGTYCVQNITIGLQRTGGATGLVNITIAQPNATSGAGGYQNRALAVSTTSTTISSSWTNYTFGIKNDTTGLTLNDSEKYFIVLGGNMGEIPRVNFTTPAAYLGYGDYMSTADDWTAQGMGNYNLRFKMDGYSGSCGAAPTSYFQITANNRYNGTSLTNFSANVTYNGSTTQYFTTNGTIFTSIGVLAELNANITIGSNESGGYFTNTSINHNTSANYAGSLFQAQVNFSAFEIFTGSTVNDFTVTAPLQSNTSLPLYLNAGSYNVTFNKSTWYNKTLSFTVAALSNTTQNFTDVYQFLANISFIDNVTNASVSTFTANITGSTYTAEASTTNGSLYMPWLNETSVNITVNASVSYSETSELENITFYLTNITINAYPYPSSVSVFIFDQTGTTILENITITVTGSSTETTYYTTTGFYYVGNLTAQTYTFKFSGDNYSVQNYILTVGNNTHQTLNVYLVAGGENVTFTIRDSDSNALIENATVTQQRIINSSWTTVSTRLSDITGRAQFQYVNDVAYRFYVTKTSYTDKSFILNPVLTYAGVAAYQVQLERSSAINDYTEFAGISYTLLPSRYFDGQSNNLSFTISSAAGVLESYGVTARFPGGSSPQSTQGTNSYGDTLTLTINISGAALQDKVNVTFWYDTTLTGNLSFNRSFFVQGNATNGTIWDLRNRDFGFTTFEKTLIATMAITTVGGFGFLYAGVAGGLVIGVFTMAWFYYIDFLTLWAILPAVLAAIIILAFRGER